MSKRARFRGSGVVEYVKVYVDILQKGRGVVRQVYMGT
jgi:hypothetical protein